MVRPGALSENPVRLPSSNPIHRDASGSSFGRVRMHQYECCFSVDISPARLLITPELTSLWRRYARWPFSATAERSSSGTSWRDIIGLISCYIAACDV